MGKARVRDHLFPAPEAIEVGSGTLFWSVVLITILKKEKCGGHSVLQKRSFVCSKTNPNKFDDLVTVASDDHLSESVFAARVAVAFEVQRGYVVVAARGARAILHRSP